MYGFNTSLQCRAANDILLKTIATARKIKISFVFLKLILNKFDFFFSFHNKIRVPRIYEDASSPDKYRDVFLVVLLSLFTLYPAPNFTSKYHIQVSEK